MTDMESLHSEPGKVSPTPIPMHRVGGLSVIPGILRSFGLLPDEFLRQAGLPADALDRSDNRLPFAMLAQVLNRATDATRCSHFGLMVGREWTLADTGLAGELARNSSNVGEALETLTIYQRLNSEAGAAYFTRYTASVALGFAVFRAASMQLATLYDVAIAAQVNGLREMLGPGWQPDEVLLPRIAPADARPYLEYFRCPVRFDSDRAALLFRSDVLRTALASADGDRKRAIESGIAFPDADDLTARLARSLRILLLDGAVTGESIAAHFDMHRRTLDRHLQALGVTFHQVLASVQYQVASQLLRDTSLPVGDVSLAVGFDEPSAFTRAFRRWSGVTPTAWRESNGPAVPFASKGV